MDPTLRLLVDTDINCDWLRVTDWVNGTSQLLHAIAFKVFGEWDEVLKHNACDRSHNIEDFPTNWFRDRKAAEYQIS